MQTGEREIFNNKKQVEVVSASFTLSIKNKICRLKKKKQSC